MITLARVGGVCRRLQNSNDIQGPSRLNGAFVTSADGRSRVVHEGVTTKDRVFTDQRDKIFRKKLICSTSIDLGVLFKIIAIPNCPPIERVGTRPEEFCKIVSSALSRIRHGGEPYPFFKTPIVYRLRQRFSTFVYMSATQNIYHFILGEIFLFFFK